MASFSSLMHSTYSFLLDVLFPEPKPLRQATLLLTRRPDLLKKAPPLPHHLFALWRYDDPAVQALIYELKHNERWQHVTHLATHLFPHLSPHSSAVLVPIPHTPHTSFHPVGTLCTLLASIPKNSPITSLKLLRWKNFQKKQKETSSRTERFQNREDAFSVIAPKHLNRQTPLIIIDDVTTTGATLLSAKRACARAGFTNISCFAIAHQPLVKE